MRIFKLFAVESDLPLRVSGHRDATCSFSAVVDLWDEPGKISNRKVMTDRLDRWELAMVGVGDGEIRLVEVSCTTLAPFASRKKFNNIPRLFPYL